MNIRYAEWTAEADVPSATLDEGRSLAGAVHALRPAGRPSERGPSLAIVLLVHLFLAWLIVYASIAPKPPAVGETITVTIDASDARPAPPLPQPQLPVLPQLVQAPMPDISVPSIQIASAPPPAEAAPVAPPSVPSPPVQKAPAEPEVTPPSFDADYLKNPPTVYPNMSRRLRETGTVLLRVRVSADGQPLEIQMNTSSGYPRLDDAARAAVRKWRFQPAMRAGAPLEAWVLVPVEFSLTR